jgi:predicted kinase
METGPRRLKAPLALWVFGPVASGKSRVLSHLPLDDFHLVDQDARLERELHARGWHARTAEYDAAQQAEFARLRAEVAQALWDKVPNWRAARENIAFETTGNKPHLFKIEIEAGHLYGYDTLACALRCPLARCLEQNARRSRVLPDHVVRETWEAFEHALSEGVYGKMLAAEQYHVCNTPEEAVSLAAAWLQSKRSL